MALTDNPPPPRGLQALIFSAQAFVAAGVLLAGIIGILWGLRFLLGWLGVAIWPVAVAVVLSFLLKPVVMLLEERLYLPRACGVSCLYIVIAGTLLALVWLFLPFLTHQYHALADYAPTLWAHINGFLKTNAPQVHTTVNGYLNNFNLQAALTTHANPHQGAILGAIHEAGANIFGFLETIITIIVTPIYLFYFLLPSDNPVKGLHRHLSFVQPQLRQDIIFLVQEFLNILVAFFRGQLLIGLIVGCILSLSLSLVGLKFGAILGITIGLTNVIPYVGTILGITVALPLSFFQPEGGIVRLGMVFGVFFVCHLFEAYVLAPRIMGKRTGLHPAAIIFSLFFWGTVFNSPLGVLLAIPLSAFWVVLWRLLQRKYLPRFETPEASL